jgi:hypothetical protein
MLARLDVYNIQIRIGKHVQYKYAFMYAVVFSCTQTLEWIAYYRV